MSDILRDLSTASLVTAIEQNLFSLISAFRGWPRAEVHMEAEIQWSITDIPFPLFNSILDARLSPNTVDPTIQSILAQAKTRNVPLLWWTGPTSRPIDLEAHLQHHGFISAGRVPGMALGLAHLSDMPPTPPGFTVQLAKDTATLNQWSQTCAAGFDMPAFVAEALSDFMRYVPSDIILAYIGWLDNKPIATSLLMLASGVAGIYNVATLPEARRQGIGALMTLAPLREARARGYQVGILHASEMGIGMYRALGFQQYCEIGQYVWLPEDQSAAG